MWANVVQSAVEWVVVGGAVAWVGGKAFDAIGAHAKKGNPPGA